MHRNHARAADRAPVLPPTFVRAKTRLAEDAFDALNGHFFDGELPAVPFIDRADLGDDSRMAELRTDVFAFPEESLCRIELHRGLETEVLQRAGELFLDGYPEGRRRPMLRKVFTTVLVSTVLHEMCHLFCVVRNVRDTVDGRHTKAFAGVAASHGLDVSEALREWRESGLPEDRFDWGTTLLSRDHEDFLLTLDAFPALE